MTRQFSTPTAYKGIKFRSRLEARWAAMFDVLGWPWEYEPETPGAYIPDFLIHGKRGRKLFVEVKSLVDLVQNRTAIVEKARVALGESVPLLIVTDQFDKANGFNVLSIGDLYEDIGDGFDQDHAILFEPGAERHGLQFDIGGDWGSWHGRLTGAYEGNALFEGSMVPTSELLRLWSRAGNAIQWRPK